MNADPSPFLFSIPFGEPRQIINSARYQWDNRLRGREPFVILQWTHEGAGEFTIHGETHSLCAGDVFIATPPEESAYNFPKQASKPWIISWVDIYGEFGVSLARNFRNAFGPVVRLSPDSVAGEQLRLIIEKANKRNLLDPFQTSTDFYAFLMEWTRELTHPSQAARDPVKTAMAICQSRFREPLGTKELAAETGLTREHLSRLFSESAGVSPGRYLRQLRVNAARQMLKERTLPLKEVALRCGFPSVRALRHTLTAPLAGEAAGDEQGPIRCDKNPRRG